jgi:predicted 3-demethylubiquinone-9 3-methyltransferase (glyoxalase superfamily)
VAKAKITPFLWYAKEAEEAAEFYAATFPDSRVVRIATMPSETPSGPAGSVKVVEFELFGQPFTAISAGPLDLFNHAVSFVVTCDDQAEIDRNWDALLAHGGTAEQCGWPEGPLRARVADRSRGPRPHRGRSGSGTRKARRRRDAENGQDRRRRARGGVGGDGRAGGPARVSPRVAAPA